MTADALSDRRKQIVANFIDGHPLARALGTEFVSGDAEKVVVRLPFSTELVHDAETRLAPGVLVTVIDPVFGIAIMLKVSRPLAIATIELKTEFVEGRHPSGGLAFNAECHALADNIAYARGEIRLEDDDALIATATATFMVGTRGPTFFTAKDEGHGA